MKMLLSLAVLLATLAGLSLCVPAPAADTPVPTHPSCLWSSSYGSDWEQVHFNGSGEDPCKCPDGTWPFPPTQAPDPMNPIQFETTPCVADALAAVAGAAYRGRLRRQPNPVVIMESVPQQMPAVRE